jgi:beta-phosphoglucomutase
MKGFIFDLDGVIVDTAKYHYLAWKNLADQLGISFTEEDNEHFKGVSRVRCLEILLEMGNVSVSEQQFESWLVEKNEDYLDYISKMDTREILPGVREILELLKNQNFPLALGSASKNAKSILEKVGLLSFFEVVVDGNDAVKAKPDPQVFLMAAERIGVPPKECVVFEDAQAGIQAANAAGMLSIGIGDSQILSEANRVFKNFTEIDQNFMVSLCQLKSTPN